MKGLPRSLKHADESGAAVATLILKNTAVSVADGAPGFGNVAIGRLPVGEILLLGAFAELVFTTTDADVIATWTGSFAVGTVGTIDSDVADANEATFIQSSVIAAATAKVSPETRGVSAVANTGTIINNQAGTSQLFLNLLIDDASISGAASFTVSGKVKFSYVNLGA
jgi:hypothetical protein